MAERARGLVIALALAGCGDDGGGDTGGTDAATSGATGGLTEGTGAPGPTSGPAPATEGETGGETGGTAVGEDSGGAPGTGDTGDGGEDSTSGGVDEPVGTFVAVGDGGRRLWSSDGEAWQGLVGSGELDVDSETAAKDALRAVAVGDGYMLAVGGGGTYWAGNAMVMRSTDAGVTWQEDLLINSPDVQQSKLYGVAISGQNAVASGVRGKRIRSGDGGLTWTDVTFEDQNARLLAVAAIGDTFVVVGWTEDAYDAPKTSAITTSADAGLTWGAVDESRPRLDTVVAGNDTFIALGAEVCLRGSDGVNWDDCGLGQAQYIGVSFAGGEFVVVTPAGIATATDGETWTPPVMPPFGAPKLVARGNDRWVGIRWTDRGFAEKIEDWTYASYTTEPLRALVFVPAP